MATLVRKKQRRSLRVKPSYSGVKWAGPEDTNRGTDMTLNEFKAWLEGYSEAFTSGAPTAAQWEKIREKLGEVKVTAANVSLTDRPYPVKPNQWFDQRYQQLDVRGKELPSFADPVVSPLLKPTITC
ncbi:hypothetical protein R5W60_04505 [Brucella pseudintermedia]|uniref:hypothetical protein n=1 Tax=Brucella pseudintermedia TaxID=370111 RepID=UPI0036721CB5|nr:hypothetical protein R5W60_04505 [Brucella pseudintermedia]